MRIQAPDLVQRIVRRYGIVGAQGPDTIAPEIVPVSIVDEILSEAVDERLAGVGAYQPAGAAQYSQVQLINPADSGVLALVDFVAFKVSAPAAVTIGWYDTALPTALDARYMDRRYTGLDPVCTPYRDDGASKVIGVATQFYYTNTTERQITLERPVILTEGTGMVVECDLVNTSLYCTIWWRERPLSRTD